MVARRLGLEQLRDRSAPAERAQLQRRELDQRRGVQR